MKDEKFHLSSIIGTQLFIVTGRVSTSAPLPVIFICTAQADVLMGRRWSKMKLPML